MKRDRFFEKKKIIICCGSGGVGKTTISAAIALQAAHQGLKVIVLTIDPAKRLATAMGLDTLSDEPSRIEVPGATGELSAMMLDTKRTFDRIIEKYAKSPESRMKILENRLYRHLSSMIVGSQEYMAMEQLYELFSKGRYDLLILDTPPTRHALDFLEAPRKMINITGSSLLKWLLKPGLFVGRIGFRGLQKGAKKILSFFDRLAGASFLQELSEMLILIEGLLGGFHDRAQSVYDLLREKFVGFILVTSPASTSIQDALYFHQKMDDADLPFSGFVINRVHVPFPKKPPSAFNTLSEDLRQKLDRTLENYQELAHRDQSAMTLLRKIGGKKPFYAQVPLFPNDVHDMEGLDLLRRALFEDSDHEPT